MIKRLSIVCSVVTLAMVFGFGNAFAATSKATCGAGDLSEVEFNSAAPIFTQTIHTASQKDLFVDVSLECGLTTNTKVMSRAVTKAISEAEAIVEVWVLVDPDYDPDTGLLILDDENKMAEPKKVTFARRYQALIAEFAGDISECINDDGTIAITDTCLADESVALILDTMSANSFNFVAGDLEAGDHEIVVVANLDYHTKGDAYDGDLISDFAPADITTKAYLGKGSVTIESVRLVKDEPISLD